MLTLDFVNVTNVGLEFHVGGLRLGVGKFRCLDLELYLGPFHGLHCFILVISLVLIYFRGIYGCFQ